MRTSARILVAGLGASVIAACGDPAGPTSPPNTAPIATGEASTGRGTTINPIYNVQIQPEGLAMNAYFKYAGTGTPVFVATHPLVKGYSYTSSTDSKNMNNGYWLARLENMRPGTDYKLMIVDYKSGSTWTSTAKTYRRQLILDVDSIHVQFDGDAGAKGCGELIFQTVMYPLDDITDKQYWTSKWHDLCDGDTAVLDNSEGRRILTDWNDDFVEIKHQSFESDACWALDSQCGSWGWAAKALDYDVRGGVKYYEFIVSSLDVSYQKVIWYGTVKTGFVP